MPDNKEYITHSDETGSVNISEEVIATIALESLGRVEGVAGISAHHPKDISELLTKRNPVKGVRVHVEDSLVTIDTHIMVNYGFAVNEVAKRIQNDIAEAVESMTGLPVAAVNVHVRGISFGKEKKS